MRCLLYNDRKIYALYFFPDGEFARDGDTVVPIVTMKPERQSVDNRLLYLRSQRQIRQFVLYEFLVQVLQRVPNTAHPRRNLH